MKNTSIILTLFCIIVSTNSMRGQDIILKTDNTIIKATVDEITESTIRYRQWDNLNGPKYQVSTVNVTKILFENGTEQEFNVTRKVVSSPYVPAVETMKYSMGNFYYNGVIVKDNDEIRALIGEDIFKETYIDAKSQALTGNILIAASIILSSASLFIDNYSIKGAGMVISSASLAAGIPLLCIGTSRLRWIAEDYNERAANTAQLTIGPTANGFGLALNF